MHILHSPSDSGSFMSHYTHIDQAYRFQQVHRHPYSNIMLRYERRRSRGKMLTTLPCIYELKTRAVLPQGGPRDAAVNFGTYRVLQRFLCHTTAFLLVCSELSVKKL